MPDNKPINFDIAGARKAGATDADIAEYFKSNYKVDFDVAGARQSGATDDDILGYINSSYGQKKTEVATAPKTEAPSTDLSPASEQPTPLGGKSGAEDEGFLSKAGKFIQKIGENMLSGYGIGGETEADRVAHQKFVKQQAAIQQKVKTIKSSKEQFSNAIHDKSELMDAAQTNQDAANIVDYYPFMDEVKTIQKQLLEIGEPKTNQQIQLHDRLVEQYNILRSKPIAEYEYPREGDVIKMKDAQGIERSFQPIKDVGAYAKSLREKNPILKNAKTVGDLLDAQGVSVEQFNKTIPLIQQKDLEIAKSQKTYQKETGYQGEEITGFFNGVAHGLSATLNDMAAYMLPQEQQVKLWKEKMLQEQIAPQEMSGVMGQGGEILGGFIPYIAIGAATGGEGLVPFMASAAGQGAIGGMSAGGATGYESYKEQILSGVKEPEAIARAQSLANVHALTTGAAFSALPFLHGGGSIKNVVADSFVEGLGGKAVKRSAINAILGNFAKKGAIPIIFGTDVALNNLYANYKGIKRDWDEGVADNMMFVVALEATMASLTHGLKFTKLAGKKAYDTYTTYAALGKAPQLQQRVADAMANGQMTEAEGAQVTKDIQEKQAVISQMPPMPFEKLQEGIPIMQNWINAKNQLDKAKKDGSPFLGQAEALELEARRKVQESFGTKLSPQEKESYAKLKEKQSGKEGETLTSDEKSELRHYEDRMSHNDRVENIPQSEPIRVKSSTGETGLLLKNEEGDMEFIPDGNKPSRVFERNEATPKKTIQDLGFKRLETDEISKPKSQILSGEVKQGADVLFGGKKYKITNVIADEDGRVVKVKLIHKNGDRRTISDKSAEGKKLIADANKLLGKQQAEKEGVSSQEPTVQSAVIEIGGKIYEGKNHAEAILKAKAEGKDISQVDRKGQGKFRLSDGTIIDRAEAKKRFGEDKSEMMIEQDAAADQANAEYAKEQRTFTREQQPGEVGGTQVFEVGEKPTTKTGISESEIEKTVTDFQKQNKEIAESLLGEKPVEAKVEDETKSTETPEADTKDVSPMDKVDGASEKTESKIEEIIPPIVTHNALGEKLEKGEYVPPFRSFDNVEDILNLKKGDMVIFERNGKYYKAPLEEDAHKTSDRQQEVNPRGGMMWGMYPRIKVGGIFISRMNQVFPIENLDVTDAVEAPVEKQGGVNIFQRASEKKIRMAERDKILEEGFGEQAEKAKFVFKNFKNIIRDMEKKGLLKLEGDCF